MDPTARFPLLVSHRRLLWLAVALALAAAGLAPRPALRAVGAAIAALLLGAAAWLARHRPVLVVDATGYAVEVAGEVRFRVRWDEVKAVRHQPSEDALHVDCGDPARNLLAPPRHGYGFAYAHQRDLCARVLAAVPDRVAVVERLAPSPTPNGGGAA